MKHRLIYRLANIAVTAIVMFSQVRLEAFADINISDIPAAKAPVKAEETEGEELKYSEIPVSSFRVSELSPETDTDLDYTDWWYSEWDDCRYIFLPATADREKLVITYSADEELSQEKLLLFSVRGTVFR